MIKDCIELFQEFNRREDTFARIYHTEPNQQKYWSSMTPLKELLIWPWFPRGFEGRGFGFFGSGQLPANHVARVLLSIEAYADEGLGTIFVGYFGDMYSSLEAHKRPSVRRFATRFQMQPDSRGGETGQPDPSGNLRVFGEEQQCVTCRGTGRVGNSSTDPSDGEPCPDCGGTGWKRYNGQLAKPKLKNRIETRTLVRVNE